MRFLPEVGILEGVTGIQRCARVEVPQNYLRAACSFKVSRLVIDREVVSSFAVHRNKLLDPRVVDTRAQEVEEKGATTLMEGTRIKHWSDSGSIDVGPVETSIQDIEAEIAVPHQVVIGGQVSREGKKVSGLFPSSHGGVGTM